MRKSAGYLAIATLLSACSAEAPPPAPTEAAQKHTAALEEEPDHYDYVLRFDWKQEVYSREEHVHEGGDVILQAGGGDAPWDPRSSCRSSIRGWRRSSPTYRMCTSSSRSPPTWPSRASRS